MTEVLVRKAMRVKEERGHGRAKQWTAWTGGGKKREGGWEEAEEDSGLHKQQTEKERGLREKLQNWQ